MSLVFFLFFSFFILCLKRFKTCFLITHNTTHNTYYNKLDVSQYMHYYIIYIITNISYTTKKIVSKMNRLCYNMLL